MRYGKRNGSAARGHTSCRRVQPGFVTIRYFQFDLPRICRASCPRTIPPRSRACRTNPKCSVSSCLQDVFRPASGCTASRSISMCPSPLRMSHRCSLHTRQSDPARGRFGLRGSSADRCTALYTSFPTQEGSTGSGKHGKHPVLRLELGLFLSWVWRLK